MYMSRLEVDITHPSARQALNNCGDMHRNLMSAFPQMASQDAARRSIGLLYRRIERKHCIELLTLSAVAPDREALRRHGLEMDCHSPKDVSDLESVFQSGRLLRFELLAAPSKKVAAEGKNSRRVGLGSPEERLDWLERQGKKYGFALCEAQEDAQTVWIRGKKKDMLISYAARNFKGILRIEDGAAFWRAYGQGIGPGKAYGMGMLMVAIP